MEPMPAVVRPSFALVIVYVYVTLSAIDAVVGSIVTDALRSASVVCGIEKHRTKNVKLNKLIFNIFLFILF